MIVSVMIVCIILVFAIIGFFCSLDYVMNSSDKLKSWKVKKLSSFRIRKLANDKFITEVYHWPFCGPYKDQMKSQKKFTWYPIGINSTSNEICVFVKNAPFGIHNTLYDARELFIYINELNKDTTEYL